MIVEIISVGTELLLGSIANTDAQDISQGLSELGLTCYFHTTVGDNASRLKDALEIAKNRSDIIITTGGLGPTYDDITKQTVCESFGVSLELHQPTWDRIVSYFASISRSVTENNRRQAMLPPECEILQNEWGTAPGCAFFAQGKHVILLPGPPRECRPMFRLCAIPYLQKLSSGAFVSRNVRVIGMGESAVETALGDIMEKAANPSVAPYAKEGEMFLRVTASAATYDEAFALTGPVVASLCETLGSVVYGVDVDNIESVVLDLLDKYDRKLAVAESCTGGMVSARLTSVPGASKHFICGICAYNESVKKTLLGIDESILHEHGVVSQHVADAMAKRICETSGADLGIGITGLAGPEGDGSDEPVGKVYLSLYDAKTGRYDTCSRVFGDERHRVRQAASNRALDMVRLYLTGG